MRKAYITSIGSYKNYISRGEVTEDEINAVAGCMLRTKLHLIYFYIINLSLVNN